MVPAARERLLLYDGNGRAEIADVATIDPDLLDISRSFGEREEWKFYYSDFRQIGKAGTTLQTVRKLHIFLTGELPCND
jgi:hypothetical protein